MRVDYSLFSANRVPFHEVFSGAKEDNWDQIFFGNKKEWVYMDKYAIEKTLGYLGYY